MKFILFKLNSKNHQKLKLKLNRNYMKNKKNIRKKLILGCAKSSASVEESEGD